MSNDYENGNKQRNEIQAKRRCHL